MRVLIFLTLIISPLLSTTITFQNGLNGYSGVKDTYIDEHYPDTKHSADSTIVVGSMAYDVG